MGNIWDVDYIQILYRPINGLFRQIIFFRLYSVTFIICVCVEYVSYVVVDEFDYCGVFYVCVHCVGWKKRIFWRTVVVE
jgi:hypothetical protein